MAGGEYLIVHQLAVRQHEKAVPPTLRNVHILHEHTCVYTRYRIHA